MRIAAVLILYHPDESVISNIRTYYNDIEKIIVFDNTESEPLLKEEFLKLDKVEFQHDHKNEGIAKRLNEAAGKLIQEQYDWLLMMDQDSSFSEDAIKNYLRWIYKYENKDKVAIFGTRYSRMKKAAAEECKPTEIHELITSGSLLNLGGYKTIGAFDEALFIDSVDHDYCIRAKLKGFSLIEFSNIYILHEIGKQVYKSSIKTLFLLRKSKEIHSPLRCYYMYRNLLYLDLKHKPSCAAEMKMIRKVVINQIKACLFYGRDTWKIIKYLIAAYGDFKSSKMGKIEKQL
jgi:rhamnosyltransferase